MNATRLLSIGTALPRYRITQERAPGVMRAIMPGLTEAQRGLMDRLCRNSRIRVRHSVLADAERAPAEMEFFRADRVPTTADRMRVYQREAPALARAAAEDALARCPAGTHDAVTHVIVVSCTGFFSPGPDVTLVRDLGLRADVGRTIIGFMGCHGAFNGLRAADAICRADAGAVVLLVCVELCSLHYQQEVADDELVANCLFADGAAAAVLAGSAVPGPAGVAELVDAASLVVENSLPQMTWRISDTGFRMTLSTEVPESLARRVPAVAEELARRAEGSGVGGIGWWAIHPGGRKIVAALGERLGLSEKQTSPTWDVLADCGNVSSATILFILRRCLQSAPPGSSGMALAFGPGLTIEALLLRATGERIG